MSMAEREIENHPLFSAASVWCFVPEGGIEYKSLVNSVENGDIGFRDAMEKKWIRTEERCSPERVTTTTMVFRAVQCISLNSSDLTTKL
jgi:hypothetical protein